MAEREEPGESPERAVDQVAGQDEATGGAAPSAAGQAAEGTEPEAPDYKDLYLRALAELDNFRKVSARERRALIDAAAEGVLRKLLDSVDALERAVGEMERVHEQSSQDFRPVVQRSVEGVRAIHRQLMAVLASEGVERLDPRGKPFDPAHHDAIARVESDTSPEGTVIDVVQAGYTLRGSALRAPRVVVSTRPHASGTDNQEKEE